MAVVFPPTPAVGDKVTGPNGEIWQWDGVKWIFAPRQLVMPMGVTDGSNAAVGQVGEFWVSNVSAANAVANASMSFNAGDWDITTTGGLTKGSIGGSTTGGSLTTQNIWFSASGTPDGFPGNAYTRAIVVPNTPADQAINMVFSYGPNRVNVKPDFAPYSIQHTVTPVGLTGTQWGIRAIIRARRVR